MQVPLLNTLPIQPASLSVSPQTQKLILSMASPIHPGCPSLSLSSSTILFVPASRDQAHLLSGVLTHLPSSLFSLPVPWTPYSPRPVLVKLALRTIIYFLALLIHCLMCMYILFLPTSQHQGGKNHMLIHICIWFCCLNKEWHILGRYSINTCR